MKSVVVCGAGIGGLASALHLRAKGYDVRIYEKNDSAGGKMGEFRRDGFRFDTGPSLITMPHVLRDFFKSIGRDINEYLELTKLSSSCKYFWEDGTVFEWYSDHDELRDELCDVFGKSEADGFQRAMEYGKLFYGLSNQTFLESEFRLRNFVTTEGLRNAGKFISGSSMNDVSNKFFRNPKLKQLFNRFATYNGSSPYLAPQFFSIIPYTEHTFGPWYVKGGIYRIAAALEKLCSEFTIPINYGQELKKAEGLNDKVVRLTFKDSAGTESEVTDFDHAVLNFTSLEDAMPDWYFKNDDWSSSGFILFAGMRNNINDLAHHNIFFSENYENEFIDIFEKRIPAKDMTVYVSISKKDDVNDAPTNCENWFILVNVPYLNDTSEWLPDKRKEYAKNVLNKLNSFSYVFEGNLRDYIQFMEVFTPLEFKEKYGSEFGSLYGLSSNSLYTLMRRPKNRSSKFSNLYFAGGNSHPGGGVPLCFISGRIVSELISNRN
jgi:phytoene desaturase